MIASSKLNMLNGHRRLSTVHGWSLGALDEGSRVSLGRSAQADGAYAEALVRCERASAAVGDIGELHVAGHLAEVVGSLVADTAAQLAAALQAVCTHFTGPAFLRASLPSPRLQRLKGWIDKTGRKRAGASLTPDALPSLRTPVFSSGGRGGPHGGRKMVKVALDGQ